jgi:multidrug efflux system outer membrane protein
VKRVFFLILLIYVAGCTMGPDYERPPIEEPVSYRDSFPPGESIANTPWWELFGDTVLQNLIDTALVHNRNLQVSMARIDEARATLGIVSADLFPRLNYAADGSYEGTSAGDGSTSSSALVALNASYVVDLWGRVRRSNEAALAELLATEEAYRGVTVTLVAEVANAYFLLRDLDKRLAISEQTAEAWRQSLDVVRSRYEAGMVSEVDVNQAEIQVYEADVSVQTFTRLRAQTENAISVLVGKPPMVIERGLGLTEQVLPPEVPAGLPSDLLTRRPDIRESEHRLHAQTARIGVAEAYKFPQFDLTADLGASFTSETSGFFGLGAQIFGPLFNSGEFRRRVDVEVARTEQLINSFEQTILNAYREVDDALVAVRTYKAETEARRRQLASAENAATLSWVRYEGGMTSYLEVLDLQRSLFNSQLKASETYQLQLTSVVRLYQTLGGGWVAEQDSTAASGSSPPDSDSGP